jgi:hypothetical protein
MRRELIDAIVSAAIGAAAVLAACYSARAEAQTYGPGARIGRACE